MGHVIRRIIPIILVTSRSGKRDQSFGHKEPLLNKFPEVFFDNGRKDKQLFMIEVCEPSNMIDLLKSNLHNALREPNYSHHLTHVHNLLGWAKIIR